MARRILLRLALALAVLLGAYTAAFLILYVMPGDPVTAMAAGGLEAGAISDADLQALRAEHGLDRPLPVQYLSQLAAAVTGDLGTSVQTGQPVTEAILDRLPTTLRLAWAALLVAVVAGPAIALVAAGTRRRWVRATASAIPALGAALPTFWTGLLLVQVFSFGLGWLPALGDDGLAGLVMPALTLGLPLSALIAQVMLRALDESGTQEYVETALASGQSRRRVLITHMLPNAALPTLAMLGVITGNVVAGAVVVETVFSRPGVGQLTVQAVTAQDLPVVLGVVLLSSLVFVLVTLTVDLLSPLLDPRVGPAGAV
ncbi:ABC transporter permease [Micrococcus porci]|uniref:ABC transporter permease n=1 Tax=Micrococcus porci TaxID=2856555 RepID=UPI001CCC237A|nr:ABC transporter permease [Micrococcus porci]UBH24752.1 ABC transporter permease [Micrococcus porci]